MNPVSLRIGTFSRDVDIALGEMTLDTRNERSSVAGGFGISQERVNVAIPEEIKRVQTALLVRYVAMIRRG
jgi:hypothetical protein